MVTTTAPEGSFVHSRLFMAMLLAVFVLSLQGCDKKQSAAALLAVTAFSLEGCKKKDNKTKDKAKFYNGDKEPEDEAFNDKEDLRDEDEMQAEGKGDEDGGMSGESLPREHAEAKPQATASQQDTGVAKKPLFATSEAADRKQIAAARADMGQYSAHDPQNVERTKIIASGTPTHPPQPLQSSSVPQRQADSHVPVRGNGGAAIVNYDHVSKLRPPGTGTITAGNDDPREIVIQHLVNQSPQEANASNKNFSRDDSSDDPDDIDESGVHPPSWHTTTAPHHPPPPSSDEPQPPRTPHEPEPVNSTEPVGVTEKRAQQAEPPVQTQSEALQTLHGGDSVVAPPSTRTTADEAWPHANLPRTRRSQQQQQPIQAEIIPEAEQAKKEKTAEGEVVAVDGATDVLRTEVSPEGHILPATGSRKVQSSEAHASVSSQHDDTHVMTAPLLPPYQQVALGSRVSGAPLMRQEVPAGGVR